MTEVGSSEYTLFIARSKKVQIGGTWVELTGPRQVLTTGPKPTYREETSTVWSFQDRGEWATHNGRYRGNWSPFVPRNLILRYTVPHETVLDPMMGGGTTLVECKLLNRNGVGIDVNPNAVMVSRDRLAFDLPPGNQERQTQIRTFLGDARNLDLLEDESIDLIATHPPYASTIRYGGGCFEGDLSDLLSVDEYVKAMRDVAAELFRVLRENGHCGILIGDTRAHAHYVPISHMIMTQFLAVGFVLKEDIIKLQHNTSSERGQWKGLSTQFYKIAHEHLYVFRKPSGSEDCERLVLSTIRSIDPRWADD